VQETAFEAICVLTKQLMKLLFYLPLYIAVVERSVRGVDASCWHLHFVSCPLVSVLWCSSLGSPFRLEPQLADGSRRRSVEAFGGSRARWVLPCFWNGAGQRGVRCSTPTPLFRSLGTACMASSCRRGQQAAAADSQAVSDSKVRQPLKN
jgi:hypothetical protein